MAGVVTSKVGFPVENKVTSTITFANDTGTVTVFTVTGDVKVKITPICKTSVTSAADGYIELGVASDADAMIASTQGTTIDADEIWNDTSVTSDIEPLDSTRDYIIAGGADIIMTLSAQIDTGVIAFECEWSPISSDGNVVAA
jgi:hypothetical protein